MRATFLVLAAIGCKSPVYGTDVQPGDDDDDTVGDDDDTVGDDDDTEPELPLALLVLSGLRFGTTTQNAAVATFYGDPADATTTTPLALEACEVTPLGTATTTGTTAPQGTADAGDVTIAFDDQPLVLPDSGYGSYVAQLGAWPVGALVSFAATGGDVPAFDVVDLLAVPEEPGPASAARDADGSVLVQWGGEPGDEVVVSGAGQKGAAWCRATDDGSFAIPAADAEAIGPNAQFVVTRLVDEERTQGEIRVAALAAASVVAD